MVGNYDKACPIWGTAANIVDKSAMGELSAVDSPRAGGLYKVDENGLNRLKNSQISEATKINLSRWIFEQHISGIEFATVTEKVIAESRSRQSRSVTTRIDDSLLWLGLEQKTIASKLSLIHDWHGIKGTDQKGFLFLNFLAATSSGSTDEGQKLLEFLAERGSVKTNSTNDCLLTPFGWSEVDSLRTKIASGTQAFVAMWFGGDMQDIFERGFKPGIEGAGYTAFKINDKNHNNKIDDEIIAEIRRSKFVVADFTSELLNLPNSDGTSFQEAIARGGVYFEAGFAKGLGKEVIWCARQDVIDAKVLHFDTRQFAHIGWKDADDLRERLTHHIAATLGDGPLKK